MIDKKLPAYTIAELLIVLVLTIVVTIVALRLTGQVNTLYTDFEKDNTEIRNLHDIQTLLQEDFFKASEIRLEDSGYLFAFRDYTIIYRVEDGLLSRSVSLASRVQDFPLLEIESIETYYQQNSVSSGLIDNIILNVNLNGSSLPINLYKIYPAKILVGNN